MNHYNKSAYIRSDEIQYFNFDFLVYIAIVNEALIAWGYESL
jgi:hypothetical protein